jgi:hypothetical protein
VTKITVELSTDEHGYFSSTVPVQTQDATGVTLRLSATLLAPFATGMWATMRIDRPDAPPSIDARAFVLWHSEVAQLGAWRLDGGDHLIIISGKTRPTRTRARLLVELGAATSPDDDID